MRIVLASASPRRAEVLRDAGFTFDTIPTFIDETPWNGETPQHLVRRLARAKADAAAIHASAPALVLGADTEVVVDGKILGKPAAPDEAREMLRSLSGKTHEVITGVEVIRLPDRASRCIHESTRVTFAPLTGDEIDAYISTGEPFDKAGGYAIQGRAGRYISRVEGCYFNVVGLPLARVYHVLRELGWNNH